MTPFTKISRSSFWATITILLLFSIFALQFLSVDSSHFAYGIYKWNRSKDNSTLYVNVEQAWRWYFWSWGNVYDPATGQNVAFTWDKIYLNPNYLRTVSTVYFTAEATSSAARATGSRSNTLKLISGENDATSNSSGPNGLPEAWWFGILSTTMPPALYTTPNRAYSAYFTLCCRISTLEDSNNDDTSYHSGWFNPGQREYSLSTTGYPREYVYYNKALSTVYPKIQSIDRDDSSKTPNHVLTATSSSRLTTQRPEGSLTVTASGVISWTPSRNPSPSGNKVCRAKKGYCAYAVSFTIQDISAAATHKSAVELDFVFISIKECLDSDSTCNHPPKFSISSQTLTTIATVPYIVNFSVSDQDGDAVRLQTPVVDEGVTFTQTQVSTSQINARMVYDVEIDGPAGTVACFQASDSRNQPTVGSFCLTFAVTKPDYMFVIGTQRTFSSSQNCINAASCPWGSTAVSTDLDSDRKPVIPSSSGAITPAQFGNWWTSGTAKLVTLTMVRYFNEAIDTSITQTVAPNPVYKDSRKRIYSYRRPYLNSASMDPSTYFTFSLTTQFDLLKTQTTSATALKFGVSGGELWVFINSKLVISLTNQQNTITSGDNNQLIATPSPTRTLTVADIQSTVPGLFTGSTVVESLTLDVFYTHRNVANSGFHMEFGSSTQCSALTILRSRQYEDLIAAAVSIDSPAWDPSKWTVSSAVKFTSTNLNLLTATDYSTGSTAWYSASLLKVLNGFEAVFDFVMTGNSGGFAFVIQSQSPTAKGSEGAGLGYHGIQKALAIEFDAYSDNTFDTPTYSRQHISGHVSPDTSPFAISAYEQASSWPEGSVPTILDQLPFTFNNGTKHNVRIEFSPTPYSYFLYVYIGVSDRINVRPVYTAQFPRDKLNAFFANGAYIGFTSSNLAQSSAGTGVGAVSITKTKVTIVPPLAELSGFSSSTTLTATAGEPLSVTIQLRDACGSNVIATGESSRFSAQFLHTTSKVPYSETQGAVYDIMTPTITDTGLGTYQFTATPTRSGNYRLYFYYQQVGQTTSQGQPIGFSPTTTGAIDYTSSHFYSGTVVAGAEDVSRSYYTYTALPRSLDNVRSGGTFFPANPTGIVCLAVTEDGEQVLNRIGQVFTTKASYDAALLSLPNELFFACVSNAASTGEVLNIIRGVHSATPTGNTEISAAWIVHKEGGSSTVIAKDVQTLSVATVSYVGTEVGKPIRIDLESASPARTGTTLGRGMILPSRYNMIYPINTQGEFYVYLKDAYGNPRLSSPLYDIAVDYTPSSISGIDSVWNSGSPFTTLTFNTQISNLYAVSVYSVNQIRSQIGADGQLVVDAGAASHLTSEQQGLSIGGVVDSQMTFSLSLYDAAKNRVLSQSQTKTELTAIYIVPSGVTDITRAVAQWTDATTILALWSSTTQRYSISYTPTWAGTYNAIIIINGSSITDISKNMVSSQDVTIVVAAGPCDTPSLITEIAADQIVAQIPTGPYTAGTRMMYTVQTKDKYGNDRYIPIQNSGVVRARVYNGSTQLTAAQMEAALDANSSSAISTNGSDAYITATYSGSGQYTFTLVWAQTTAAVNVKVQISGTDITSFIIAREIGTSALGALKPVVRTADWTFAVNPGLVSDQSIFAFWCTNAPCTANPTAIASTSSNMPIAILPRDVYGNEITPSTANLADITAAFSIQYESSLPAYNFASTYSLTAVSGKYYTGAIQTTVAGTYTVDPQFVQSGAQISRTIGAFVHSTFVITADVTNMPRVSPTVVWPEQLYQIQSDSEDRQTISFTDQDQFSNRRIAPAPATTFQVFTRPSATASCDTATALIEPECTIETGQARPNYQCSFGVVQSSPDRIMIITTMSGSSPTCGLDANNCPNTACSVSKSIPVIESEETSAYIYATATLSGSTYTPVKTDFTSELTANKDVGTFKAGVDNYLFVRDSNNLPHTSDNIRELRLLPQGGSSKFATTRASSQACAAATFGTALCPTEGVRVWVFKINYEVLLATADAPFAVYFSAISTAMNGFTYSLQVQPGTFSAQKSLVSYLIGTASLSSTAGSPWSLSFTPYDLFGNQIPTQSLFTGFSALRLQMYDSAKVAISTLNVNACAFPSTGSVVTCTIPGTFFTKANLQGFYFALDTLQPPSVTDTILLSGKMIMLDVAHSVADLARSFIHFSPTATGDAPSLPATVGQAYTVYFFAFDAYLNPITTPSAQDPLTQTSTNKLTLVIKSGDLFHPTPVLTGSFVWTKTIYWTRALPSYSTTITFDKPTRVGFRIAGASGSAETPQVTVVVRSAAPVALTGASSPPSTQGTGLYSYINSVVGSQSLSAADLQLTIDSVFTYAIKVFDTSTPTVPYLNIVTSPTANDVSQFIVNMSTTREITDGSGSTVPSLVSVPASIKAITTQLNGITYAVPGQFVLEVSASSLTTIGTYDLIISINTSSGSVKIAEYEFTLSAGLPVMDNTEVVSKSQFQTGNPGSFRFYLRDRLSNRISSTSTNFFADQAAYLAANAGTFSPITDASRGQIVATIHTGFVDCTDVHEQLNPSQLTYAQPRLHAPSYPDYTMNINTNADGSYSALITPVPKGVYTFNMTLISATDRTMPQSYFGCDSLIPLSFTVASGNPLASQSYYTIQPASGSWAEQYVGYAGTRYNVQVTLLDRDGSPTTPDNDEIAVFYTPTSAEGSLVLSAENGLYHNPTDTANSNIDGGVTVQDLSLIYGSSYFTFSFIPTRASAAAQFAIYLKEADGVWRRISGRVPATNTVAAHPAAQTFRVNHGAPTAVQIVTPPSASYLAGETIQFESIAVDKYNNPITTNELSTISVVISREASSMDTPIVGITGLSWTVPSTAISTSSVGVSTITFVPTWEGQYSIQIILQSVDGSIYYASTTVPEPGQDRLQIAHATCAGQSLASGTVLPYMCTSDNTCVAGYTDCPTAADSVVCANDEVLQGETCVKFTALTPAYVRCEADGSYVLDVANCPVSISCPSGTVKCASSPSQCRATQADCPSTPACAPGQFVCPNQLTCATSLNNCPSIDEDVYDTCTTTFGSRAVVCASGVCVQSLSDCPTAPTCADGEVFCLTDNTCAKSASECNVLPSYQVQTPSTCLGQFPGTGVLCSSGTCASSQANCPSQIVCPIGFVLCARDNSCRSSRSLCPAAPAEDETIPVLPDDTTIACSATEFRCASTGACVQNLLLCPTQVTCPATSPVLCADRSCKASLAQCTVPPTCAAEYIQCATTSQCVTTANQCASAASCPEDASVRCSSSGECVDDISKCPTVSDCPNALPYRCPSGDCRSSLSDCSSAISCPATKPMTCPDLSCALSLDMCITSSSTSSTSNAECLPNQLKCPSGACTTNILLCPSVVTCPIGSQRCIDGSCRTDCSSAPESSCSARSLISCPATGAGIACARTIAECPQGPTCPTASPVKCIDSTCAISLDECPPLPSSDPPSTKVACSDGSWAEAGACPTAITCIGTVVKCLDNSCVSDVSQCPLLAPCDFESNTPYRCNTGSCVASPWDCTSPDPVQCTAAKPIRCNTANGVDCVAELSTCLSTQTDVDTEIVPETNDEIFANPCSAGQVFCRSDSTSGVGSCADSSAFCPEKTCSSTFPVMCADGSCATSAKTCPAANGCPWDKPTRCSGVGKCVARLYECPQETCTAQGVVACPDGSCSSSATSCKAASGCGSTQFRCADATCVDDVALCTSQANSDYANSCPPGANHRCGSGLCVADASQCLDSVGQGICTDPKAAVLCADGICRQSTELCPLIKPCETGLSRCGDGTCKNLSADPLACPNYDPCSEFGEVRCKQANFVVPILDGVCSSNSQCFSVNGCPVVNGRAQFRCTNNGRCVDGAEKATLCTAGQRLLNGCLSDKPTKCWNGSCAASTAECPATNNCPAATPFRCSNGNCAATSADCSSAELTCPESKVICADGSCVDSISSCLTSFGCPIDKPVRCQNGECKQYPATLRSPHSGLTNEEINTLTCPPTVSCPANYYLCEDLSCVLSTKSCPSIAYACSSSEIRCADSSCRPSYDLCGYDVKTNENGEPVDENGDLITDPTDYVWEPSSSAPIKCPTTSPLICPNGGCVGDILQCDRNSDPSTTTLTGSPTSSQPDSTKPYQVLCFDGTYRDNYKACRDASVKLNEEQIAADPTAAQCIDFCADGTCVRTGQLARNICPAVPACAAGKYRCADGSCLDSCSGVSAVSCSGGLVPDIDGQCRAYGQTLSFRGCFTYEPYMCPSRECADDADSCESAANRNVDDYAKELLRNSVWANPSSRAFVVQQTAGVTSLVHDIPNSLIAEFFEETLEAKDTKFGTLQTSDSTTSTKKSCTSNCLADQQLYRTSLVYSPLLASQTYTIGPLATGFTLQLYSGLQVNSANDLSIYIEPVGQDVYFNASNRVTYSRVETFGETMTSAQTVLSPVFSCIAGDGIVEPFDIGIQLTSLIDRSKDPTPAPSDVCLARLRRYPEYNYAVWECLFNEAQRTSGDLQYSVRQSTSQPLRQAISFITRCSEESDESDAQAFGILQDDSTTPTSPIVYAFIHSPVSTGQVYAQSNDNWFKDNIIWLLFVIIGGVCLIFFIIYAIMRLSRYAKKTENIKKDVETAQKEIEDMEQYGEKRRDLEVGYVANPLAISLEQQQALADQTDEEKIARKKQLLEAQQADSVERQEVIGALENDVDAQLAALEALRKKAGAKHGGAVPQ